MKTQSSLNRPQYKIVARIKTKCVIVHGNRELIRIYEEKVKKVIERVWEG